MACRRRVQNRLANNQLLLVFADIGAKERIDEHSATLLPGSDEPPTRGVSKNFEWLILFTCFNQLPRRRLLDLHHSA